MSFTFELGISSADAVELLPEYDYKSDTVKIENRHRAKSGRLYTYLWASYDQIEFSCKYVPASAAAVVNSWWESNTELLFFVTSNSVTEVYSVVLNNKDRPFQKYSKPYADRYEGKILLEGY